MGKCVKEDDQEEQQTNRFGSNLLALLEYLHKIQFKVDFESIKNITTEQMTIGG